MTPGKGPLVSPWLRERAIALGAVPGVGALARQWYRHHAAQVAGGLTRKFGPKKIYLRGSVGGDDFTPGLSDLDFIFVAKDAAAEDHVTQICRVRGWLKRVPRPWVPLGEVGWMTAADEEGIRRFSARLGVQHAVLKEYAGFHGWVNGGWGGTATPRGTFELAFHLYLGGFHRLQLAAEGQTSERLALLQADKFWRRSLALLAKSAPSKSAGDWAAVTHLGHACFLRLHELCAADETPRPALHDLPSTATMVKLAGYLRHQYRQESSQDLDFDIDTPYYFLSETLSGEVWGKWLSFNYRQLPPLYVKIQFPILTGRLAAHYLRSVLPRVLQLNALFAGRAPVHALTPQERTRFAADLLYLSNEALLIRPAAKLREWGRALRLFPRCPTFSPLLEQRSELFFLCAEREGTDEARC